jgi:uncharacterized protein YecE (DUF72 family)
MALRIGTAAWALPRTVRDRFPAGASNLERYAGCFDATEINSSFYRPHKRSTYERWAASVPDDFRFAVKLPKAITHEARLVGYEASLTRFAEEISGLGDKRGPVLIQFPPNLAFDAALSARFFESLHAIVGGSLVCEPRHPSWFESDADALLASHWIARVAADPARVPSAAEPGGWMELAYFRLHGSPRIYYSSYEPQALADWYGKASAAKESWVIFDNTTSGAATANALTLRKLDLNIPVSP